MKVRTYGFNFDRKKTAPAMPPQTVFEKMAASTGTRLGISYQFGAARVQFPVGGKPFEWWGGMMVRIRDSRAYLKLTEKPGSAILSEETLGEGERLAEVSFFLVHPGTGNGLLTHHYHATSFNRFGAVCSRVYEQERRLRRDAELQAEMTAREKKALVDKYRGKLEIGQLLLDANLKELVKTLKYVSSADFNLTTVKTKDKFLQGVAARAESEKIRFTFSRDEDVDELAEHLGAASANDAVQSVDVIGRDKEGIGRHYSSNKNPAVFDEYDYDTMMKGLKLDLLNWKGSIENSSAIKRLGSVAAGVKVFQLLQKG